MFEYLETLNPEQTEAVIHTDSPLLILAGAGSGKTRVITTKIAYLIQKNGVSPEEILAVTFTKKAAAEMRERAVALEPFAAKAQIRTFHSFGAFFLRLYAEAVDVSPNFTVYDDVASVALLMKVHPELTKKQANNIFHRISLCKDYCLTPKDCLRDFTENNHDLTEAEFSQIYQDYQDRLKSTGNVDFGDLILLPYQILQKNANIRRTVQNRYRVIMVDEYQDSNVAQFELLKVLSGINDNNPAYVCVVGDDDQSIYKFRGAEVKNILQFPKIFPETTVIKLERNYRSMGNILKAAEMVVSHNKNRLGKTLIPTKPDGEKPEVQFLFDQADEVQFCANAIKNAVEKGAKYSDYAILYRTNAQSLGFETEFLHREIPYKIVGSLKFFEREEIKDAIAYLCLIVNDKDEIAFERAIQKPSRGVGTASQEKILAKARLSSLSLVDNAEKICSMLDLPKKAKQGYLEFATKITNLKNRLVSDEEKNNEKGEKLSNFIKDLIETTGLVDYHKEKDEKDETNRVANLEELVNHSTVYECSRSGLLEFLDSIELDRSLAENLEETQDCVTLITLHNTKGLEFNRVFITGLENGIFPRFGETPTELEEERRLFYVGITRAKDWLCITSCENRLLYGKANAMSPSMFLTESKDAFEIVQQKKKDADKREKRNFGKKIPDSVAYSKRNNPKVLALMEKFAKGKKIFNDDYGTGYIISCENKSGEVVIKVQFETGSLKTFLPEHQAKKVELVGE